MATLVIPSAIVNATTDQSARLQAFLDTAKPGDTVQNPKADAEIPCDKDLLLNKKGVRYLFEGAQLQQLTQRPYVANATRICTITGKRRIRFADGHLQAQLPMAANYGYIGAADGVPDGTHIQIDSDRRGGTLDKDCTNMVGVNITFTSQADRSRCGFRATGKDCYVEEAMWVGPFEQPHYVSVLEGQHAVDCHAADGWEFRNVSGKHMQGDLLYHGAASKLTTSGAKICQHVQWFGGVSDYNARSGVVPINSDYCTVEGVLFDHVGRTVLNVEPPDESCWMDHFAFRRCIVGSSVLNVWSSGGKVGAHVGAIEFSDNWIAGKPMTLWLIVGDAQHQRGPYTIARNHTTSKTGHGGTYPTAALICISHSRGATVIDNKGIVLQAGRNMAVVRDHLNSGPVVVHGNDHVGGIEHGPWV